MSAIETPAGAAPAVPADDVAGGPDTGAPTATLSPSPAEAGVSPCAASTAASAAESTAFAAELPRPAASAAQPRDPQAEVRRILSLRVTLVAVLASKRMTLGAVRRLSPGMIIEFGKQIDEPLWLQLNGHTIGGGPTVRVNEHFGLRLTAVGDAVQRIKSLGG